MRLPGRTPSGRGLRPAAARRARLRRARPGLGGVRRAAAAAVPRGDRGVGAGRRRRADPRLLLAGGAGTPRRGARGAEARPPGRRGRARGARAPAVGRRRRGAAAERRPAPPGAAAGAAARRPTSTRCRVLEACEVVAGLYARIHVPAPPQLRSVTSYVDRWTPQLARCRGTRRSRAGWCEQAVSLGRDLVGRPDGAAPGVLIHGDLHYENVLAGDREPWLVIDPKPSQRRPALRAGTDALEPLGRGRRHGRPARSRVRRRFHTLVDAAGPRRGPGPRLGRRTDAATTRSGSWRTTRPTPDHD